RPEKQRVIERLATLARSGDEDRHLLLDPRLADVVGEPTRAYGAIERLVLASRRGGHGARPFGHDRPPDVCTRFSASRIRSSVAIVSTSSPFSIRSASAGL